jgi:hypothetical protein
MKTQDNLSVENIRRAILLGKSTFNGFLLPKVQKIGTETQKITHLKIISDKFLKKMQEL